jgi:predicted PurR-regulated permease PerM
MLVLLVLVVVLMVLVLFVLVVVMVFVSRLSPVVSYDSESTSSLTPFRHFGRTPWTGDRHIARSLPTQDDTIQKTRT